MGASPVKRRRIMHLDMDAFFASVEEVINPALKGKPLIIGGDISDTRGVVSTASYAARKFGVHSAMPLAQAKQLCPHGVFMRGHYDHYREASEKVHLLLHTLSPQVESVSIDEAYVDVTGSQKLFGGDDAIAHYIKKRIREETQLPCTLAIAPNKLVAKIGSDAGKPDGYLCIQEGEQRAFMASFPIHCLPGVGPRTGLLLESQGIQTIGDLASLPMKTLLRVFGQSGYALQRAARGISTSPVQMESIPKSIGRETTFERDSMDWNMVECTLSYLMERAAHALREKGMETRCVTLKIRYADFTTHTFAKSLVDPTSVDHEIHKVLMELLPKARARRDRVRLIGVSLSSLTYNQHQLYFFTREQTEKWERALETVDQIRERYGFGSLRFARSMHIGHENMATPALSR